MSKITAGQVFKYAALPGIIPRMRTLMGGGFSHVSCYMAQIFRAARLLPFGHPYLNYQNFGRYGVTDVISEVWRHIMTQRCQADQFAIFFIVLVGVGICFIQFCILAFVLISQAAYALPPLPTTFLDTANPTDDVAFILLDLVFGIPPDGAGNHFFGSCVAQEVDCFPSSPHPHPAQEFPLPFHEGLRTMLQIYSVGLLVIAMLIFSYFAVAILLETAESGTPFGKRFNALWAPIRMIMAIALLIPIANGLNAAQYVVLYAAKWGSGFATNGWNLFLAESKAAGALTILGDPADLIANPNTPPVNTLMEFGTVLSTCKIAYASMKNKDINAYLIFPEEMSAAMRMPLSTSTYTTAVERANYGDLHYVFGLYETTSSGDPVHTNYPGYVKPVCGEIVLRVTDVDDVNSPGSRHILSGYHDLIYSLWDDIANGFNYCPGLSFRQMGIGFGKRYLPRYRFDASSPEEPQDPAAVIPDSDYLNRIRNCYETRIDTLITAGIALQVTSPAWTVMDDYGWAAAGIWYNNIARLNGTLLGAANTMPSVSNYPEVMEFVKAERVKFRESGSGPERFNVEIATDKKIKFDPAEDEIIARTLNVAFRSWGSSYTEVPTEGINPYIDIINMFFGTEGLFNLSDNTDIHPLAALTAMGKSMMETAIRNLGSGFAAGIGGGLANLSKDLEPLGKLGLNLGAFFVQVGMMTLSIGFLMFYVLPFLPFLYYFFAVGGWIKGIFESIVAVPLWALAHIRIDGESLPGDAARGGYFMILEIFLRPILIVFSLLAAITIYAAQVKILNEIWQLVVSNVTGYSAADAKTLVATETGGINSLRGAIDQLFFTIMYAIFVYLLGMSSFKLIDLIPSQIMRWLGTDVSGFTDQSSTGPDGLMMKMSVGTNMVTSDLQQAAQGLQGAVAQGTAAVRSKE